MACVLLYGTFAFVGFVGCCIVCGTLYGIRAFVC